MQIVKALVRFSGSEDVQHCKVNCNVGCWEAALAADLTTTSNFNVFLLQVLAAGSPQITTWHGQRAGGGLPCILVIGEAALAADLIPRLIFEDLQQSHGTLGRLR